LSKGERGVSAHARAGAGAEPRALTEVGPPVLGWAVVGFLVDFFFFLASARTAKKSTTSRRTLAKCILGERRGCGGGGGRAGRADGGEKKCEASPRGWWQENREKAGHHIATSFFPRLPQMRPRSRTARPRTELFFFSRRRPGAAARGPHSHHSSLAPGSLCRYN